MEKCDKCGQLNGVHKMGCETRRITTKEDMTKCTGIDCKLKDKCYRYAEKSNNNKESYFTIPPLDKLGDCEMFWGLNQEHTYKYLKDITNGKSNDSI